MKIISKFVVLLSLFVTCESSDFNAHCFDTIVLTEDLVKRALEKNYCFTLSKSRQLRLSDRLTKGPIAPVDVVYAVAGEINTSIGMKIGTELYMRQAGNTVYKLSGELLSGYQTDSLLSGYRVSERWLSDNRTVHGVCIKYLEAAEGTDLSNCLRSRIGN